jgi:CubicO group peptidase (beta-lactamase class C family)
VDPSLLAVDWPGEPAIVVSAWRDGGWQTLAQTGDLDAPRPWASVSKLVTALCAAREIEEGHVDVDVVVDARGATLAHLLSHSSGLGLEESDPVTSPGVKRIYSNYGIDLAASYLAPGGDVASWLGRRAGGPLGLKTTRLVGRASEGLVGSTRDLTDFARQWVQPTLISPARRDATASAYLPHLDGIVPGFGRFSPCPWGLGVEIRGEKRHWMGDWPAASFGHFGRSGALALVNVDEGLCLVATSTVAFGAWAHELWPTWTSRVRELAVAS